MSEPTIRDLIWDYTLTTCANGDSVRTAEIADEFDVSTKTARRCLREMANLGWLTSEGGQGPVPKTFTAGPEFKKNSSKTTDSSDE